MESFQRTDILGYSKVFGLLRIRDSNELFNAENMIWLISYGPYVLALSKIKIFIILALGYGSIVNKIGADDYVDFKRSVRSQSGKTSISSAC